MGRACNTNGAEEEHMLLLGNPEGERPLGRPKHMLVHNIKMDLGEIGWGDMDWIGLAQDRDKWRALVKALLNFQVL
jgi:hypothetical protein